MKKLACQLPQALLCKIASESAAYWQVVDRGTRIEVWYGMVDTNPVDESFVTYVPSL